MEHFTVILYAKLAKIMTEGVKNSLKLDDVLTLTIASRVLARTFSLHTTFIPSFIFTHKSAKWHRHRFLVVLNRSYTENPSFHVCFTWFSNIKWEGLVINGSYREEFILHLELWL